MATETRTVVRLTQQQDYTFDVSFDGGVPALRCDEPPPLGQGSGPSPVQLLAAAVGNCLSDSLLFALRKFKQQPEPIHTEVVALVGRNAEGRMRVQTIEATITLGVATAALEHLDRVLATFEDYCTVTRSVGAGIDVRVRVMDATGAVLKG